MYDKMISGNGFNVDENITYKIPVGIPRKGEEIDLSTLTAAYDRGTRQRIRFIP